MPLPAESSRWLPETWAPAFDRYRFDEAIWLNDTATLSAILNGASNPNDSAVSDRRFAGVAKRRGLIVNLLRRWGWVHRTELAEKRTDLPVPIGANIVDLSAAQLMSEPPMFHVMKDEDGRLKVDKGPMQARLDLIAGSDDARMTMLEGAQTAAALGGAILKAVWDLTDPDREAVAFDVVGADCALPEFLPSGRLAAVTLFQEYPATGDRVYRHFERHYVGGIEHALYLGGPTSVGRMVPLDRVEEIAPLLKQATDEERGTVEGQIVRFETGLNRLTAAFWRNRPTRVWRRSGVLANLGRSDFELVEPLLDAYSEAWASMMRDVRLGKARAFVPPGTLERIGTTPGAGAMFDPDREFYQEVSGLSPEAGAEAIRVEQPDIRWEEHMRVLAGLKMEILDAAGWSMSSYGNPVGLDSSSVTATEVVDRTTKSERTRDEKALYFKKAANGFVRMLVELDGQLYPGAGGGPVGELAIDFPDVSQVDPEKQARTFLDLSTAKAISIEQMVRERRPNWDDDEVEEEVTRIMADLDILQGGPSADPTIVGRIDNPTVPEAPPEPPPADDAPPSPGSGVAA